MKTNKLGRKIKSNWRTAARTSTGASTINKPGKSGENKTRTNIRTEDDKNIWATYGEETVNTIGWNKWNWKQTCD